MTLNLVLGLFFTVICFSNAWLSGAYSAKGNKRSSRFYLACSILNAITAIIFYFLAAYHDR